MARRPCHYAPRKACASCENFRDSITEPCVCRLTRDSRPASICRINRMDHSRRNLRRGVFSFLRSIVFATAMLLISFPLFSQDTYEIEVYGSETFPGCMTMGHLHSNFTCYVRKHGGYGRLWSGPAFE